MAEFLTTRGISYNLEEIIKNANKELYIITPYLKFSQPIYEQLKAISKEVVINFVYGKTDLKISQEKLIKELNCNILYKENLHAKCYLNENTAIIASMNLHSYSEVNNYEMGILVDSNNDNKAYQECKREIELICLHAKQIRIVNPSEISKNSIEKVEYDRSQFYQSWESYLKSFCKDVKFTESEDCITFHDYPTKNVNMKTKSAIVTFEIQLPYERCRQIKGVDTNCTILSMNGYRVFWNTPYNKIELYWEKKIKFNALEDEIEYCRMGFHAILEKLKDYQFDSCYNSNSECINTSISLVNAPNQEYAHANKHHICDRRNGFCIRCGKKMKYKFQEPMCNDCYQSWSYWRNYEYEENHCHCCGMEIKSSFGRPLCLDCFKTP